MSHTNYNSISAKPETAPEVTTTPNTTLNDTEKSGVPTPDTSNVPAPPPPIYGTVSGCTLLNVRENPSLNAKILSTIKKDSTVLVDLVNSTDEWYKVIVNDQEGFCMKQYITLPQ